MILDAVSGLRGGELLGLKWEDVRFDQLELNVTRCVSRQVLTPCKTEVSGKPIPMNPEIANMLWRWRQEAPYNQPGDWIFASPHKAGIQPYWPGSLYRAHVKPALKASISAKVGWHTLRHSFGTLMKANGEDLKTIQELLRHATFKVTADTYTQAVTPVKRDVQARIAKLILLATSRILAFCRRTDKSWARLLSPLSRFPYGRCPSILPLLAPRHK